eukprot:scaffold80275_cov36-Phaeocystis_antarctica.AAC.1
METHLPNAKRSLQPTELTSWFAHAHAIKPSAEPVTTAARSRPAAAARAWRGHRAPRPSYCYSSAAHRRPRPPPRPVPARLVRVRARVRAR